MLRVSRIAVFIIMYAVAALWAAPAAHTQSASPPPNCSTIQLPSGVLAGSEDCLRVNVWVSDPAPTAPATVIVWLHTGAFFGASANFPSHNGEWLAVDRRVIVVAPNYRLGPFGFLAHGALASEDPLHPASGSYGLLDQRAALVWVRDNIALFGGDPSNVTLAGTSAGAESVGLHLVSPGSAGLFQRAIVQSSAPTMAHSFRCGQGDIRGFPTLTEDPFYDPGALHSPLTADSVSPGSARR